FALEPEGSGELLPPQRARKADVAPKRHRRDPAPGERLPAEVDECRANEVEQLELGLQPGSRMLGIAAPAREGRTDAGGDAVVERAEDRAEAAFAAEDADHAVAVRHAHLAAERDAKPRQAR